jgi:hypothetical protein
MGDSSINFTQGATSGGAGFALIGVVGTAVTVSNGDDSDLENWEFTVIDVGFGSSVPQGVVQDSGAPTWTFTPDVAGCYVVQLVTTDDSGNVFEDTRVFGVLETNGLLTPSFTADAGSMNFVVSAIENTKGWSPFLNAWLRLVMSGGGGGGATPPGTSSTDCTAGGTVFCTALTTGVNFTILSGTPGSPFIAEFPDNASPASYLLFVTNATAQPAQVNVVGQSDGPILQPGGVALFGWDSVSVLPYFLSLSSVNDQSSFQPSAENMASVGVNQTNAQILSLQVTSPQTLNYPLPGTAGNPITTTPGLFTFDVNVRMQNPNTLDAAWFKYSWGVSTEGAPSTLGSAAVQGLAIGTSVATPQTIPAGWGVALQMDGPGENLQVVITGDGSGSIDVSVQAEWNNLR